MSFTVMFSLVSVTAASLITTFRVKEGLFAGRKCESTEEKDGINCARVCMRSRCNGFEHRAVEVRCCIHGDGGTQADANNSNMLFWEKIFQREGHAVNEESDHPKQRDYLFVASSSSLYVYHFADKSWGPAIHTGAHVYGLVFIPKRRELYVTKYGEIHRSKVNKPKDGERLQLVFEKYTSISRSSIHGLTIALPQQYLFTLGMCDGRHAYGIIRVQINTNPLHHKCVLTIAKGDSFFEDQVVADETRKRLMFMSSFEKKLRECDYDGNSQRDLVRWTFTKALDILYSPASGEFVYSDRKGVHKQLSGNKEFSKVDTAERPRCITELGNNTVVLFETAGVILDRAGKETDKIGTHVSMLACSAIHVHLR